VEILDRKDKLPSARVLLIQYVLLAGFAGLIFGLWQLQVLQTNKWAMLARHNRVRTEPIPAPRGRIYDRHGRLLVDNYPAFTAYLLRDDRGRWRADLPGIARGLFIPLATLQATMHHDRSAPVYQPIPIKQDITPADVAFIAAHHDQFPELETIMASRRLYPKNGFAANLIGYVGEPTQAQLASGTIPPGAVVGKSGLEAYYNTLLTGRDGERRVLVDARGRVVGTLSDTPPVPGHDLHLTLDNRIQLAAELALGNRPGAVVALDPRTGGVLAMVSRPTFDPNLFAAGVSAAQWHAWLTDPGHPLMNKAIQAQLAPGSIFKLVVATAGLQQGMAENKIVNCQGVYVYGGHTFHCWIYTERGQVHGPLDVSQAIQHSCDVYFYTLGMEEGISMIDKYAFALGLGNRTGIDLPNEAAGLIPTPAWKQAHYHAPWYKGETVSVAIGQGPIMVTPIQLARLAGGIASGGDFPRPHLVRDAGHTNGFSFPLQPVTVADVTAGMRAVVEPGGTAASAHLQGIDFGGKTGTAQTISDAKLKTITGSRARYVDNVWFVGVSPVVNPKIAVCVLFQHGAESSYAAQIAAQVVQAYYKSQAPSASTPASAAAPATPAGGAKGF
jgi:penicillin-binding protein 2